MNESKKQKWIKAEHDKAVQIHWDNLARIRKLKEEGLLSDDRFAEAYIKSRYYSGFGPVRIQYELEKKGVLQNKIENAFQETGLDWDSKLEKEFKKKYLPQEAKLNYDKIIKFFLYRGFDLEKINKIIKNN